MVCGVNRAGRKRDSGTSQEERRTEIMGSDTSGELLSVTLTSIGLESALQRLSER